MLDFLLKVLLFLFLLKQCPRVIIFFSQSNLLCLIDEVVLDLVLRLPVLQSLHVVHFELLKIFFVHDASDEIAEPEHG